jgi:hypothetical protein
MWRTIGQILIGYAVIAIILLLILRWDALRLWEGEVKVIGVVIDDGERLIDPLIAGADAVRAGGQDVTDAANTINSTVPPAVASIVADLKAVESTIQPIPNQIASFVSTTSTQVNNSVNAINTAANVVTQQTIPGTTSFIRQFSVDLFQPPYWLTADVLNTLKTSDSVPANVLSKLQPLVGQRYIDKTSLEEDEKTFRDALKGVLSAHDYNTYADNIVHRSTNAIVNSDVVAFVENLRLTIDHVGKQTLPSAAKSTEDAEAPMEALVVLTDEAAGPLFVAAEAIRGASNLFLKLINDLGGQLKIDQGQWARVVLPPTDITIGGPSIDKGSLLHFHKGLGALGAIDFDVPDHDAIVGGLGVHKGDWVNSAIPPAVVQLYNGNGLKNDITALNGAANKVISAIVKANDITISLQKAADSMRTDASKLTDLAENPNMLIKRRDSLKAQAKTLFLEANAFDDASTAINTGTQGVDGNLAAFVTNLKTSSAAVSSAITGAITKLETLETDLGNFSVQQVVNDLDRTGQDLTNLANAISDNRPIGTPGKSDLVQKVTDLFEAARKSIPPNDQVVRIVNAVIGFLVAVHVAILLIGVVFVSSKNTVAIPAA